MSKQAACKVRAQSCRGRDTSCPEPALLWSGCSHQQQGFCCSCSQKCSGLVPSCTAAQTMEHNVINSPPRMFLSLWCSVVWPWSSPWASLKAGQAGNAHTRGLHKPGHAQPWKKEVGMVLLLLHHHFISELCFQGRDNEVWTLPPTPVTFLESPPKSQGQSQVQKSPR